MPAQCVRYADGSGDDGAGMRGRFPQRSWDIVLGALQTSPKPPPPDHGVDYIMAAIGRQITVVEWSKLPWPVKMVITVFDGALAGADVGSVRSRITSALVTYCEVEDAVRGRGHGYIARTLTTFFADMERLLGIAAKVDWPARSGIVTLLTHRWSWMLTGRRDMARGHAELAETVVSEWQQLVQNMVVCIPPDHIPTLDIVRFREAFVEVAAVMVADRRTLPSLQNTLLSRSALFRLATDTVQALSPACDLGDIALWNDFPPLVRMAATEYAADQGRSVHAQRTAMRDTAVSWTSIWPNRNPTEWVTLLSQLLGDEKLPARLQARVAAAAQAAVVAGWMATARTALIVATPSNRWLTVDDLDRAVNTIRTEVERSLL